MRHRGCPRLGRRAPARYPAPMALGAILVSQGLLTSAQLEDVAAEQQRTGERLEQVLARRGLATGEQVLRAVAEELSLPFVRLDETEIDEDAVRLVPARVVFRLRAFPFRIEGGRLLVATSDPLRLDAFDQLRVAAGMPVDLAVAEDADIGRQIRTRFGVAGDVLDALGAGRPSRGATPRPNPMPRRVKATTPARPAWCGSSTISSSRRSANAPPTSTSSPTSTSCMCATASTA
jgi:hypothetical protein